MIDRTAKQHIGKKIIIPGRAAQWWDQEIREKVQERRELYSQLKEHQNLTDTDPQYVEELEATHRALRGVVKRLIRKKKKTQKRQ